VTIFRPFANLQEPSVVASSSSYQEETDDIDLIRQALESDEIDEEMIKKVLELADRKTDVVELDLPGLKKMVVNLERKINANQMKVRETYSPSRDPSLAWSGLVIVCYHRAGGATQRVHPHFKPPRIDLCQLACQVLR